MSLNADLPVTASRTSLLARIGWGLLIVATLYVCYFSHLGALGFVGPDEPRYAWVAREMVESGDWVTPRLYGRPWFEKPVLYYWGAALSFKLFGVSEAAARLPSAVSALLATLALAWLARRIYGAETARWLLLLLPTTVGMVGFSHAAATDMPFSAMLTIAMVCAAVILRLAPKHEPAISSREPTGTAGSQREISPSRNASAEANSTPWLALILFGCFLGLAVLAKGPVGIVLCGGAVFCWALFTRRWRDAFRLLHPVAIASFCLATLPWYILCAHRNADFFHVFIIEHNFKRFLTPEFHHIQPFWFYGPILFVAVLPWTAGLLWAMVSTAMARRKYSQIHPFSQLLGTAVVFCLIFFSASKSKLPGYILPAVPPLGLLLSHAIASNWASKRKQISLSFFFGGVVLFLAGVLLDPSVLRIARMAAWHQQGVALLILALAIPAAIFGCVSRPSWRHSRALSGLAASAAVCLPLWLGAGEALGMLGREVSGKYLASAIQQEHLSEADVTVFRLNRARVYQLDFYLHSELAELVPNQRPSLYVITTPAGSEELRRSGIRLRNRIWGRDILTQASLYEIEPRNLPERPAGGGELR